jgi:glycopeptide antibiotics resistance protein
MAARRLRAHLAALGDSRRWTLLVALSYVGVLWMAFPRDLQWHSHWYRVAWIPFVSPPVTLLDTVLNTLLFVPSGVLTGRGRRPHSTRWFAAGVAIAIGCELMQVFTHGRIPSTTDVCCNLIGLTAGDRLGAALAGSRHQ